MRGGDLHLHVDGLSAHVERTAEYIWEAEDIVDLVGIVRAPGGDNHVVPRFLRVFWCDFRVGVGHGEYNRVGRHGLDHVWRERTFGRQAEEDVGADHRLLERSQRRIDRMCRFPLVHAFRATAKDDALGVAQHHVRGLEAYRLDEIETGDACRSRAVADEARGLDVAPCQMNCIDHARGDNNRRPMLIVVKDGNVHRLPQALLDVEAFGRLDVLEIDPPERRPEIFHRVDEFFRVFRRDLEVDRVDVGETLEQHRLALHHRLGGQRPEIAEAEDRGSVRDDGDQVAARGVVIRSRGIGGDRLDRNRHSRRIGQRQIALRCHGLCRDNLEFAGTAARVKMERLLVGDRGGSARSVHLVSHGSIPA